MQVTARYIHGTLKNSSMAITNMIGPTEQVALDNHPCRGIYFMVLGSPEVCLMKYNIYRKNKSMNSFKKIPMLLLLVEKKKSSINQTLNFHD